MRDGKLTLVEGVLRITMTKDYLGKYEMSKDLKERSTEEGMKAFQGIVQMNCEFKELPEPHMTGMWNLPPPNNQFCGFVTMQRGDIN
jgi:hypothetical protein